MNVHSPILTKDLNYAYFSLKRAAFVNTRGAICYPGSRIPKWFENTQTKDTLYSITIDISSDLGNLLGFVFCCVVPQFTSRQNCSSYLKCQYYFEDGRELETVSSDLDARDLNSDNVFVWFAVYSNKGSEVNFKTHCHKGTADSLNFSFLFFLDSSPGNQWSLPFVGLNQACGVYPIYASEYHNFLQQMDEIRKTKRRRESNDEEQQPAPTKKLNESSKSMASHSIDELN